MISYYQEIKQQKLFLKEPMCSAFLEEFWAPVDAEAVILGTSTRTTLIATLNGDQKPCRIWKETSLSRCFFKAFSL